jgi:hypothetical protein
MYIDAALKTWSAKCKGMGIPIREQTLYQGRGVHVTGVSAAYTFKLNKNILSE